MDQALGHRSRMRDQRDALAFASGARKGQGSASRRSIPNFMRPPLPQAAPRSKWGGGNRVCPPVRDGPVRLVPAGLLDHRRQPIHPLATAAAPPPGSPHRISAPRCPARCAHRRARAWPLRHARPVSLKIIGRPASRKAKVELGIARCIRRFHEQFETGRLPQPISPRAVPRRVAATSSPAPSTFQRSVSQFAIKRQERGPRHGSRPLADEPDGKSGRTFPSLDLSCYARRVKTPCTPALPSSACSTSVATSTS